MSTSQGSSTQGLKSKAAREPPERTPPLTKPSFSPPSAGPSLWPFLPLSAKKPSGEDGQQMATLSLGEESSLQLESGACGLQPSFRHLCRQLWTSCSISLSPRVLIFKTCSD